MSCLHYMGRQAGWGGEVDGGGKGSWMGREIDGEVDVNDEVYGGL